ncbi:MAG: hypothetical protein KDB79_14810, partial [Acidobacteria bacterium]|nr:hypothetical protein [Acidobacteriota bacterium]
MNLDFIYFFRRTLILCLGIILLTTILLGGFKNMQAQANSIVGYIVDYKGEPVVNATIFIHPVNNKADIGRTPIDKIVLFSNATQEGKFNFDPEYKNFNFCATYAMDMNVFRPLVMDTFCTAKERHLINIGQLKSTNLGKVKVTFNTQLIELRVVDRTGKKYISENDLNIDLSLKIKGKGITAVKVNIPAISIDRVNSAIRFYLPEGGWEIRLYETGKTNL